MAHGQPSRPVRGARNGLAVVAGLAAVACASGAPNIGQPGPGSPPAANPGATASAKTDGASGPVYPLTDLPAGSAADAARQAVAVDLGPKARGLSSADVVFEEFSAPVRYVAVFQSQRAAVVGPVVGTQPTDSELLSVMRPLIGYDGGAPTFIKILDRSKVTDAGATGHPGLYATTSHGVTVSVKEMLRAVRGSGPPPPVFIYRGGVSGNGPLTTAGLSHPASVRVSIPGYGSQSWAFDSHTGRWQLTSGGPEIAVANLVVQIVPYRQAFENKKAGVTVPSARVLGTGQAQVFSGSAGSSHGTAAPGTWSKPHLQDVTNYFDKNDRPMAFQPGPTWVILAPQGTRVSMSGGQ